MKAVPSALRGLTSLFGMGKGGPPRYSHHELFVVDPLSPEGFRDHHELFYSSEYLVPSSKILSMQCCVLLTLTKGEKFKKNHLPESFWVISTAQL